MEKTEETNKKLYRSRSDRMIAGVCGGLGKYFELDSLIFRIIFLLLVFGGGFGVLLYIILALIIPNEPVGGEGNPGPQNSGEFKDKVNEFAERVRQNANEIAKEAKTNPNMRSMREILGFLIVAFGAILLLGNLFPGFVRWDLFWPLALIAVGLLIVAKKR